MNVEDFIAACCELDKSAEVSSPDLYQAWLAYSGKEWDHRAFGHAMTQLGYPITHRAKNNGPRMRRGIRLKAWGPRAVKVKVDGEISSATAELVPPVQTNAEAITSRPPSVAVGEPPAFLSDAAANFWREIVDEYPLEIHHRQLLTRAAQNWDRIQELERTLRRFVRKNGSSTYELASGKLEPHPALAKIATFDTSFRMLIRELGIEEEPSKEDHRGPRVAGRSKR